MVSISTLFAFWIVALALIWNRYFKADVSPWPANYRVAAHLAVLVAASVGELLPVSCCGVGFRVQAGAKATWS